LPRSARVSVIVPASRPPAAGGNRSERTNGADGLVGGCSPSGHAAAGVLGDRVAIVAGAGCGIGRTTALLLARSGARVVVASRSDDQIRDCVKEIERNGGRAAGILTDIANEADVERLVERCVERFGGLDILVNNPGDTGVAALVQPQSEQWRRIAEINLFGPYHCSRAAIPHLVARGGGKIINIVRDSSVLGYPMSSTYAASEHSVIGLTKALAEELKPNNIQVNAVCPSIVDTDMAPKAFRAQAISRERVADVILFLASAQSDGVTGEMMRVFSNREVGARLGDNGAQGRPSARTAH
jgi:NAD(P)-dependent dehydrogenase (short-subunit alcohol dehydrogenase family)